MTRAIRNRLRDDHGHGVAGSDTDKGGFENHGARGPLVEHVDVEVRRHGWGNRRHQDYCGGGNGPVGVHAILLISDRTIPVRSPPFPPIARAGL